MPRHLPLTCVFTVLVVGASPALAQTALPVPRSVVTLAATADGRVSGTVADEAGRALGGAAVVASGATLSVVESDSRGHFSLVLPVGDYLLRVVRDGYLVTHREVVRVEADRSIERHIRLTRRDRTSPSPEAVAQPSAAVETAADPVDDRVGHGEMAWRLRYLRRTVLRDIQPSVVTEAALDPAFTNRFDLGSFTHALLTRPASVASAFLADTDFTGHVNLLMTGSVPVVARPAPAGWSRGVADVFLGAPVGETGSWSIRGAMAAGDRSSWTLAGEYRSPEDQPHAVRLAMAYSTQGFLAARDLAVAFALPESRSAGSVEVSDRWRPDAALEVAYGLRLDRYDYVAKPNLVSPHAGVRAELVDGTVAHVSLSRRMVAPGASELVPPSESGPWLPPARAFVPLAAGEPVSPSRIDRRVAGVDQRLGASGAVTVGVEWFSESTANQMATLFGLDDERDVGHYYVATVGDVSVTGWRVRARGEMSRHVHARVEYAEGRARWYGGRDRRLVGGLAPSLARSGRDTVSDLRTAFDITVPATRTELVLGYQVSRVNASGESVTTGVIVGRGLDIRLRQRLPYQPLEDGLLNALFTLSTLLHDQEMASLFDDVLTVRVPARLTAGLQLGF